MLLQIDTFFGSMSNLNHYLVSRNYGMYKGSETLANLKKTIKLSLPMKLVGQKREMF